MDSTEAEPATQTGTSRREELTSTKPSCAPKVSASVMALRHAAEVIPNLWVGDIRSVSYMEDLVRMSSKNCAREQDRVKRGAAVTFTVISVVSNPNLLKFIADSLDQKRRYFLNRQHLRNEEKSDKSHHVEQDGLEYHANAVEEKSEQYEIVMSRRACSIESSIIHSEHNLVPIHADETTDTSVSENIGIDIRHIEVPLRDSLDSDLMSVLSEALAAIDEALGVCQHSINRRRNKWLEKDSLSPTEDDFRICLVHCAKGVSRSVSIIIGYLLSRHSNQFPSFDAALKHVRSVRPPAMPNVRFAVDLRRYAKEINK